MIARGLAASGAKVYITGRRQDVLEKVTKEEKEGDIVPLPMDVTDKQSIIHARDVINEKEGRLHILVNKCVSHLCH